jgi:AcrR family transcriptional regulator
VRTQRRGPGRPSLSNEELLDKALDLFLEQGFERTSIDAITAAAGVAKRTVYQRYGDKDSLFKAALQRAIEEWIVPIEELRAAECDDTEQCLLNVGRILVANIMNPAGLRLMRITNAESGRMPEIGAYTYHHGTGRTIDYLADLFRRRIGPDSMEAEHWSAAAIAFLYLVVCGPPTMTAWGMSLDQQVIDSHTAFGVHLFLNGLLPRGEVVAADARGDQLAVENARLRALLVDSMLEVDELKRRLDGEAATLASDGIE